MWALLHTKHVIRCNHHCGWVEIIDWDGPRLFFWHQCLSQQNQHVCAVIAKDITLIAAWLQRTILTLPLAFVEFCSSANLLQSQTNRSPPPSLLPSFPRLSHHAAYNQIVWPWPVLPIGHSVIQSHGVEYWHTQWAPMSKWTSPQRSVINKDFPNNTQFIRSSLMDCNARYRNPKSLGAPQRHFCLIRHIDELRLVCPSLCPSTCPFPPATVIYLTDRAEDLVLSCLSHSSSEPLSINTICLGSSYFEPFDFMGFLHLLIMHVVYPLVLCWKRVNWSQFRG